MGSFGGKFFVKHFICIHFRNQGLLIKSFPVISLAASKNRYPKYLAVGPASGAGNGGPL